MNTRSEMLRMGPPVVLIMASAQWISTARLAMALHSLGCRVELVAPANHPALSTIAINRRYAYKPLYPLAGLRRAIERSGATTVIAADELMVLHLEELWNEAAEGSALRELLTRSIGGPRVMAAARSRMVLTRVAQEQGVDTPETVELQGEGDLARALSQLGFPVVFKADATSGGRGVRVLQDATDAEATRRELSEPPGFVRALGRGVKSREWVHLRAWKRGQMRGVTAQKFIEGSERTAMAVCHEGVVAACVCLEVMQTWEARGPSSVLRVVQDEAMELAIERVAGALKVTGLCGFDFMVEAATGKRLLLEMNPRPTQMVHLPLGHGRDLIAAYLRDVAGMPRVADRPAATTGDVIALFPQELQRDAASDMLRTAHHDVPWSEPALIERAMKPLPEMLVADARWRGPRHVPQHVSVFVQQQRRSV